MCLVVGCRGGGPGTCGRRRLCGERRLWVLARDFGRVGGEVAADVYCRSGAPRRPAFLLLMKTSALLSWLALLWSDLWPCGRGVERDRGKLLVINGGHDIDGTIFLVSAPSLEALSRSPPTGHLASLWRKLSFPLRTAVACCRRIPSWRRRLGCVDARLALAACLRADGGGFMFIFLRRSSSGGIVLQLVSRWAVRGAR